MNQSASRRGWEVKDGSGNRSGSGRGSDMVGGSQGSWLPKTQQVGQTAELTRDLQLE